LTDHRRRTERCIEAWNRQTYPRDKLHLLLLYDGTVKQFADTLPKLMLPQDKLVLEPGRSELDLYNVGVRRAATEWVFISEPHVEPLPGAAEAMMRYLASTGLDGAACYSEGSEQNNFVGRLEDVVFALDLADKGKPGHWNKIYLRGCCLRRSAFLDAGGFDTRYGHFSEPLLGARLRERGYRLGLAEGAICLHYSTSALRTVVRDQIDYGFKEMRCCTEIDGNLESRYFSLMEAQRYGACVPVRSAGALWWRVLRRRGQGLGGRPLWSQTGVLPFRRAACVGRRLAIWSLIPVIHACRWRPTMATALAHWLWQSAIQAGREAFLLKYYGLEDGSEKECGRLRADKLGPHNSLGFHGLENNGMHRFRWTRGAALVLLPLPAGRFRVAMDLLPLREHGENEHVVLEAGASVVEGTLAADTAAALKVEVADAGNMGALFIFSSTCIPADNGDHDRRELGVACAGVRWWRDVG
jgi:hypothetical protein